MLHHEFWHIIYYGIHTMVGVFL